MARMVGVLAIATIARRWELRPLPGPAPCIRPILTLKPARPLCLRVERVRARPSPGVRRQPHAGPELGKARIAPHRIPDWLG
jgi:hypothetical protein